MYLDESQILTLVSLLFSSFFTQSHFSSGWSDVLCVGSWPGSWRTSCFFFCGFLCVADRRLLHPVCFVHNVLSKEEKRLHVFENYILHACKEWFIIFSKRRLFVLLYYELLSCFIFLSMWCFASGGLRATTVNRNTHFLLTAERSHVGQ